ncbi:FG-GAP repeat protein [Grimontia marina]|uniref:FG-GAP repeat protein n=1 Tax=Grimontia marina TaxID=646534 RepID=A0A128F0N1_9GAMM|nr:FG-GAP repeat protein [Grimontia marina]CZF79964.1 hypothetical protein GMA8713_01202 [Grimontia marina]
MKYLKGIFLWSTLVFLNGCNIDYVFDSGSGASESITSPTMSPPSAFNLQSLSASVSSGGGSCPITFSWDAAEGASRYTVCRKDETQPDNCESMGVVSGTTATINVTGALKDHLSEFFVKASNEVGSTLSNELSLSPSDITALITYIKASNTDIDDSFGRPVSLSSDGSTLAVGAYSEASSSSGINSPPDNLAAIAGAVYVFRYLDGHWAEQAYLKASNSQEGDRFGWALALSADGNTIAVGAYAEDSSSSGVNSIPNEAATLSGAAYIFRNAGGSWSEEAYIKASNPGASDYFGWFVTLSSDGNTLAVGAYAEDSSATGVNNAENNSLYNSGATYVYRFTGGSWAQEAYIKASNPDASDYFGYSVSLSGDGNTLAVGATWEDSDTTGINSTPNDLLSAAGAAYVFRYSGGVWSQQAYVKASNTGIGDRFGWSVSLSGDGNVMAVSSRYEDSSTIGVDSVPDEGATDAGAVYIFRYSGGNWGQDAYIKASNTGAGDYFGWSVDLSSSGNTLAVGAREEDSGTLSINSTPDDGAVDSGAAYIYRYENAIWAHHAYLKSPNTGAGDNFGVSVSLGKDGGMLAVGAFLEDSSTTGVGSTPDEGASNAGAAYIF